MTDISQGVQRANVTLEAMQEVAKDELVELESEQLSAKDAFLESQTDTVNPLAAKQAKGRKKLDARDIQTKKGQESKDRPSQLLPLKDIEEKAQGFQSRNPLLKQLSLLSSKIKDSDKAEDILAKVKSFYPDVALQEEALQFLLEITTGDLNVQVQEAVKQFKELNGRDVEAGKNVAQKAMEATKELGNYSNLTDLLKDIVENPRDAPTLFDQLFKKYGDYKKLVPVINFLLHNIGAKVKKEGLEKAELKSLITAAFSLLAIKGVFRFFTNRMSLVEKRFKKENMSVPLKLNFELLSKAYISLLAERYPSSEKVKQQALKLGIEDSMPGQIIVFEQCRDAIYETALHQMFRSVMHRDEVKSSIIDALQDIEENWEMSLENNMAP